MSKTYTGQDVANVLDDARERMNKRGKHWVQQTMRRELPNGEMGYCSVGAILAATNSERLQSRALAALETVVGMSVTYWNDRGERTWGDVSRAFRKAARLAAKS